MHIQFLGASQEVTGSKYLIRGKVEGNEYCFLIDYGMFQGGHEAHDKNLIDLPIDVEKLEPQDTRLAPFFEEIKKNNSDPNYSYLKYSRMRILAPTL